MDQVARRLFTTDEFHRLGEIGILSEDDRVELIDGELVRMSPIGKRHAACVDRSAALFFRRLGRRTIVRVQNPIILGRRSELHPDLALLKPKADFYAERAPVSSDVLLVVEVVDSSGEYDRGMKLARYARAGIAEVWLVDLLHALIEVCRRPMLRGYRERQQLGHGQRLSPLAFPRTVFRTTEILG